MKLGALLSPRSIAVVGASADPSKFSGRLIPILKAKNYTGSIYPINARRDEILGVKCYPDLASVPGNIDCVVYSVGVGELEIVLDQCAKKSVKLLVMTATGFAERGDEEGRKLQDKLTNFCREAGIRIIGPNCVGFINMIDNIPVAAAAVLDWQNPPAGGVGLISQSGGVGLASGAFLAFEHDIGFSYLISTGNEADLDMAELGNFLVDDPNTHAIALTIESVRHGDAFKQFLQRAGEAKKPVVILKSGRSELGKVMAKSHTGALAGSAEVFDALCAKYAVTCVDDIHELCDIAQMFCKLRRTGKLQRPDSAMGCAAISVSGGHIGLFADLGSLSGLTFPEFSAPTQTALQREMKSANTVLNPIDLTGGSVSDPSIFGRVMKHVLDDRHIEIGIPVLSVARSYDSANQDLIELAKETDKIVIVTWSGGAFQGEGKSLLRKSDVPLFETSVLAVKGITALLNYRRVWINAKATETLARPQRKTPHSILQCATKSGRTFLTERESKAVLAAYGFPVTKEKLVTSAEDAVAAAKEIGYPVAAKGEHPEIAHKSEAGIIQLGLKNADEVYAAYHDIHRTMSQQKTPGSGVLIQEMVAPGAELILGCQNDPTFGPTIMFGLGGIYVEAFDDVSLKLAPVTKADALAAIAEVKGSSLLKGARGRPVVDVDRIADLLVLLSQFAIDHSDIVQEIDINPLIAIHGSGELCIADALIVLNRN